MKTNKPLENEEGENTPPKFSNTFKALTVVGYTTGFIIGPMVVFGGIGWWLSKNFDNVLFVFGGLILALIVSNILIFRNTSYIVKKISKR